MTFQICYWDEVSKSQKTRDSTPTEDAQRAIDIAAAPPVVPLQITRRQAIAVLYKQKRITLANIEAAIIAHLTGDEQFFALNDLRESQVFERSWPLVISIGPLMGLTPADLDDLFIVGKTL